MSTLSTISSLVALPVIAEREYNSNGLILYEGPSKINGEPIVVICTGLTHASQNSKTGNLISSWILPTKENPVKAVQSGSDEAVCGSCPARGTYCYVNLAKGGPLAVYETYKRGRYKTATAADLEKFKGRKLRIGSYGEGTAADYELWETILKFTIGHTAYTHRYEECDQRFKKIMMASVETEEQMIAARKMGWRTFRNRLANEPLVKGEFMCPASKEGGMRTKCDTCLACDGGSPPKGSVTIVNHGTLPKMYMYTNYRKVLNVFSQA